MSSLAEPSRWPRSNGEVCPPTRRADGALATERMQTRVSIEKRHRESVRSAALVFVRAQKFLRRHSELVLARQCLGLPTTHMGTPNATASTTFTLAQRAEVDLCVVCP